MTATQPTSAPTPSAGFSPVTRATLSEQIRDRLLERISSGVWQPGARVPSERDLSEMFGVARTSVREAMQGLVSIGVIERRGNRSYVVERLPDVHIDVLDDRKEFVRQLFETRRLLEIPIIELAAMRATPEERDEITAIAERFRGSIELEEFRQLDRVFHAAIAAACRNPILVEVYQKVMNRLFESPDLSGLLSDEVNADEVRNIVDSAVAQHAALACAVAAGDVVAAAAEGTAHLAQVERSIIDRLV